MEGAEPGAAGTNSRPLGVPVLVPDGALDPAAPQCPDVELRQLTKCFGDFTAVDRVDLDIRRGEFISLLGPSGCGKTTTLNLIAGFEEPTSGDVLVGGRSMAGVPPHRRDVNTVFQSYALFPHMNVLDNVGYGLKQRKVGRNQRRRQGCEALELVGLKGREQARPADLSGGQQQRVALARALVLEPRVLLLDEPLGALDLKLRRAMQIELKRIQREVEITFVFVTHDQDEAMTMSDRIAVMHDGRIEHLGPPAEIYDRPATPFVAEFIGEMNVITGTLVARRPGAWRVRLADGTELSGSTEVADVPEGATVAIGIRPERLRLRGRGAKTGGLVVEVITSMVAGHQLQTMVRLAASGEELLVRRARDGEGDHIPAATPEAAIDWEPEAAVLLGRREAATATSTGGPQDTKCDEEAKR